MAEQGAGQSRPSLIHQLEKCQPRRSQVPTNAGFVQTLGYAVFSAQSRPKSSHATARIKRLWRPELGAGHRLFRGTFF